MREELLAAVRVRTAHAVETGHSRWVLAPEALEEAGALLARVLGSGEDPDLEVLRAVGELYWLRVQALPVDECDEDLRMAAILYQPVYQADPDAVPEQLRSLYAGQARRPKRRQRKGGRVDPAVCTDQGAELFGWFRRNGDLEALEKAVYLFRTALSAVPEDHPMYGPCLSNMHTAASALADETGGEDVLQEAVSVGLTLLEVMDERDPEYPEHAGEVGLSLRSLFERTGVVSVLRKSVELARSAVAATSGDGAIRAGRLSNLGVVLQMLHEHAGDARAIDEAITAGRDAVAAIPVGDPDRATCLSNLGNALRVAFEANGGTAMLREAVAVGRAALESMPEDDPGRAGSMSSLGGTLQLLYEHTGDRAALAEAVAVGRAASAFLPADHTALRAVLANLGVSLRELFEVTGDANLLHEAVVAHRQVDAATPDGHPGQAGCLTNLGNTLRALYDHSGDRQALDDAVAAGRRAVAAIPDGHPLRAAGLSNLGGSLLAQFDETDDLRTLGDAVSANRKALAAILVDHPWHIRFQSNLGISLHMLFKRTGDLDILREAIAAGRAAVIGVPDGHPELIGYVTGLSATLRTAFTKSEDRQALSDARNALADIAATSVGALDGLPEDDPVRSMIRSDLESAAQYSAEETGSKQNPDPEVELDERPGRGSTRDQRIRQVRGRVDRFTTTRAPEVVLGADAIGEVVDLLCSVPDPVEDIEVAQTAGWLFWSRFAARGTVDGEPELMIALDLLAPLYPLGDGAVPEPIGELWDDKPPAEPDGAAALAKLGRAQFRETQENDDAVTLNQSVDLLRRAIAVAGPDHPDYARCLTNLGSALLTRFERAELPADLTESIEFCRAAVGASRPDEPARATYLSNLGSALLTRFEHLASEADLDAAIEAGQAAVTGWPDHPDHAAMVSNLDLALRTRTAFGDQAAELNRRIEEARTGSSAPDGPDAAELSELLAARFQRAGDPADQDEAIQVCRDAVATAVDDSERASHLSALCDLLLVRFVHLGDRSDLTDAIAHGRAAVATTPAEDPELGGRQTNLGNALSRRYKTTGDLGDLEEAAALGRNAVAATPVGDFNRPNYLVSICDTLRTLFERTGRLADLDEAVEAGRAAIDAAPQHSPNLPAFLGNLGAALLARFRRTGSQTDLDESVDLLQRAALAAQGAGPDRALMLANLGVALQIRFDAVGDPEDLDKAIAVCRNAVRATPLEHPGRAARLSNLAGTLQARFRIGGEATDLDEAVEASRSAVAAHPPGHPAQAQAWSNHALVLRGWYEHTGRPADLDAAVAAARTAVAEAPADHPDRPAYLANLTGALRDRHARTGADADLDGALAAAREAASADVGPPRVRAVAAAGWGSLAAAAGRWAEAVAGYQATIDLLARTVPRQLTRRDQEFLLDGAHGTGSDAAACCVRVGSVTQAVELFEQGRGLLLSQALDSRTDLTALAERHPELADRFTALCAELDSPGPADDVVARRATATAFDRLVADIQKLPGFDRFLCPPAVADLAPDEGQVVIVSVSQYGSYALIVPADGEVTAVPLPTLTPDAVLAEVRDFLRAVQDTTATSARTRAAAQDRMTCTLGWLWDTVAGPVLDAVGITRTPRDGESWPRLWWCPSDLLSFLPLHAAGHHDTAASDAVPRTVLDRVVCSVTPTLRAFAHSRRAADSPPPRAGRAVVVAMPKTPGGYADLSGAEAETAVLRQHFPGEVDVRTGTAATHDAVLDALAGARWAHFACHGRSDLADPSAGRLVLADHHNRPLTVTDLARLRMDDAELAFLSACSTARPSGRLADEAIHLASAFQLAGYRHVIGTLWRIGDWQAVDVADLIYSAIADGAGVAEAVHSATRQMRDRWPDDPSAWASHIHVGT